MNDYTQFHNFYISLELHYILIYFIIPYKRRIINKNVIKCFSLGQNVLLIPNFKQKKKICPDISSQYSKNVTKTAPSPNCSKNVTKTAPSPNCSLFKYTVVLHFTYFYVFDGVSFVFGLYVFQSHHLK